MPEYRTLHSRVMGNSLMPGVLITLGSSRVRPASFTLSMFLPDCIPQILMIPPSGLPSGMLTVNSPVLSIWALV